SITVSTAVSRLDVSTAALIFFRNEPPTTEIYTLSLHDALPISRIEEEAKIQEEATDSGEANRDRWGFSDPTDPAPAIAKRLELADRKSTRLNSSHVKISYAVFCLKKKKKQKNTQDRILSHYRIR